MFLSRVLEPPRYGWSLPNKPGELSRPSRLELWSELLFRADVFHDRKNWLVAWVWGLSLALEVPAILYLFSHFTWESFLWGALYGLVVLPTVHNTFYLHRYCTHHAFDFRNRFWLQVARNFTWRLVPEETYVISHHVHHSLSEQPGDPYNAKAGWLYCFLADATHQGINRNLSRDDYAKAARMLSHTGIRVNSYDQYQRWGTVAHPFFTLLDQTFNWALWIAVFYWLGGLSLVLSMCAWTTFWNWGIRTFNFRAHAGGKNAHKDGRDFHRDDLSVNLPYPGFVAGEWHNNHHLLPGSARAGFLPHQLDLPWLLVRVLASVGIIRSYRDQTEEFFKITKLPKGAGHLLAHDWRDCILVALSALEVGLLLAPALLQMEVSLTPGWLAFGALLVALNCTNFQCVAHNMIHTPFFRSERLNRAFSVLNTLALGVPQTLYRVYHLNHHRYNNDAKEGGTTGDLSSFYRHGKSGKAEGILAYSLIGPLRTEFGPLFRGAEKLGASRLAWVESTVLIAFLAFVATIHLRYFIFFFVPVWYLGQVAALVQNYLEHWGADPQRLEANSVSSYGRLYNALWFNNGYHQEHHFRPNLHWTKLPAIRAALSTNRCIVPFAHAFSLLRPPRVLNPPGSYGVLAVHEVAGSGQSHAAQAAVCRGERGRGEDRRLPSPGAEPVPARQADPVDLL